MAAERDSRPIIGAAAAVAVLRWWPTRASITASFARCCVHAGLTGTSDDALLEWAAGQGRVLLTHDVATITAHAYRRVMKGEPMPGVFEVSRRIPIRDVAEDIILLSECSEHGEWEGQVRYLPLR